MTIARVNPGAWVTNDQLTPAQINGIDVNTTLAPDFVAGGTYTPSATVNVGGSGITLSGTSRLLYASRSLVRIQAPLSWATDPVRWTTQNLTGSNSWKNVSAVGGAVATLYWGVRAPNGQTITQVRMRVRNLSETATVAASKMQVQLGYYDFTTDADVLIGSAGVDPSTTQAQVIAFHWVSQSGLTHTVDNTSRSYYVVTRSEFGANGVIGDEVHGCEVTCTVTDQNEWV